MLGLKVGWEAGGVKMEVFLAGGGEVIVNKLSC